MKKTILRTNLLIAMVIIIGFIVIEISTNLSFRHLFVQDVEYVSKLTSENIYMGIKELMSQPLNVSLSMARDNFLREFMAEENSEIHSPQRLVKLQNYLTEYKNKNGFDSVFLVSTKTGNYYHYKNGIDRVMSPNNEEDIWFYDFLKSDDEYALNVDNDQATDDHITIFVNCKLKDNNGNLLGVIGVGMETPYIQKLLGENENKYQIAAYLIDDIGNIQLSSSLTEFERVNLFDKPTYNEIKTQIINNRTSTENKWYSTEQERGYFVTRYISYLNWYLVVEKSTDALHQKMLVQLWLSTLLTIIVICFIITVLTFILKRNYKLMTILAEVDQLTGLRNRTSYECDIGNYEKNMAKYQHFGIGIFDLNKLKSVNDRFGHQEGDLYLKTFSDLLRKSFNQSPVYRIGGDEFCIIFLDFEEDYILKQYELLKSELEKHSNKKEYTESVAFGYAFYDATTAPTTQLIFSQADQNMYEDKKIYKAKMTEENK
ncbi:MAG: diguanylate cyclase [Oscillospiraceae bacterium]